jgi:hypothetical protein
MPATAISPSAPAILDLTAQRSARKAGRRGTDAKTPLLTRNALVADFLAACQLDPEVESVRVPDEDAQFDLGGSPFAHRADFEVIRDGSPVLVDVAADTDLAVHPLRTAAIHGLVSLDGRPFGIETAASIRREPRFTTIRLILACRRSPVTAGDRVRILHQLDELGTMRLVDCASAALNASDGVAAVLALACEGLVAVDIGRPILPETPVRRRRLSYADPFGF